MRICHVVYAYFPQAARPRRAAKALSELGNEVHVIAMQDEGESREEEVEGLQVHRIPLHIVKGPKTRYLFQYAVFLLAASALLLRLHANRRFDVVHVHSLPDFQVFSGLPERLWGTRLILDLHEAMPELYAARFGLAMDSWSVRIASALEKASCLAADGVIVVNEVMKERIVRKGVPGAKVTVVMNSPDLDGPKPLGVASIGTELNPAVTPAIIYVGGVNPERDLETLVRATGIVNTRHQVSLAIVGHGSESYRQRLRDTAAEVQLHGFLVKGRVPYWQAASYMELSVLGPVTYQSNPLTELAMPTKALEYAAVRKPLIIANLYAIRGIFGDAALYYQPGDPQDLARKIDWVLEHPEAATDLATKACSVLEAYGWSVMRARLVDLYESLVTEREPPVLPRTSE